MNQFTPSLLAAAIALFSVTASFAGNPTLGTQDYTTIMDNDARETYTLSVLAVHPDGNRAYTSGTYATLSQALMAYQAFSADLPDGSTVVYANITDSNGNIVHSISNDI